MRQPSSRSISRRPSSRRLISAATSRASPRSVEALHTARPGVQAQQVEPDRLERLHRVREAGVDEIALGLEVRHNSIVAPAERDVTILPRSLTRLRSQGIVQLLQALPHLLRVLLE